MTAVHGNSSELSSIAHIQCTCKASAKPAPSPGGMWLDGLEGFAVLMPSSLGGVAQVIDRCRTLTLAQAEPCDTTSIKRNLYSVADLNCAREVSVKLVNRLGACSSPLARSRAPLTDATRLSHEQRRHPASGELQ